MVYSRMVEQALTTKEISLENFHFFVEEGNAVLKTAFKVCAEQLKLADDQKDDFIDNGTSVEFLALAFDTIIARYRLPVYMGKMEEKNGISEKNKAGMVRALLYVLLAEDQIAMYQDIVNVVLKIIPLENPLNELKRLVQRQTDNNCHLENFLVIERIGGTEHCPIHKAIFDFKGYVAEIEIEGSKTKARKAVAKKWLAMYKSKEQAA